MLEGTGLKERFKKSKIIKKLNKNPFLNLTIAVSKLLLACQSLKNH